MTPEMSYCYAHYIVVVQSLGHIQLFATPWTAACQASLSFTNSRSLLKLMSLRSVMPSNHLVLCCPLLLPPTIPIIQMEKLSRIRSERLASHDQETGPPWDPEAGTTGLLVDQPLQVHQGQFLVERRGQQGKEGPLRAGKKPQPDGLGGGGRPRGGHHGRPPEWLVSEGSPERGAVQRLERRRKILRTVVGGESLGDVGRGGLSRQGQVERPPCYILLL